MKRLSFRTGIAIFAASAILPVASAGSASASTGPYLVKNIMSGPESSNPGQLVALGDVVVFSARGGGKGYELWRSDGSASGTVRVMDIRPGGQGSGPHSLTRVGDLIFFAANDGVHGDEPWVTDGTSAGTHLVKDIAPGPSNSWYGGPDSEGVVADVDGVAFFTARPSSSSGEELWHSDGTEPGTEAVPGAVGFSDGLGGLVSFNGRVYFTKDGEFWRSDGTAPGTKPVRKANGVKVGAPNQAIVAGSLLYFTVQNSRLWRTNGTAAGTTKVFDTGIPCGFGCDPWWLAEVGDELFFTKFYFPYGIWKSDGTPGGTTLVRETDGLAFDLVGVGDTLYFSLNGLWSSDGTEAGTQSIDIPDIVMWCCNLLHEVAGTLYFDASIGQAPPLFLWRSDGTAEGTEPLGPPPEHSSEVVRAGDIVYFAGLDSRGLELWAYKP